MKEAKGEGSSKSSVAVYKGLTVTVYNVDKTELTLSRRDLINLVKVRQYSSLFSPFGKLAQWAICLADVCFFI